MIRCVDTADREEWLRMRVALWPGCPLDEHLAEMAELLAEGGRWACFVAERAGGGLCGFLEASIRPFADGCESRPVGYIEGWYVAGDNRLEGIGGELVHAAEAWARALGCTEMASDCELENQVSLQAHLALGYEETERLIHFRKPLGPWGAKR